MSVRIFGAPARYLQGPGLLSEIGPEIARLGRRAVLVVDAFVRDMVVSAIAPSCAAADVSLTVGVFSGELSPATLEALIAELRGAAPDVVIGAGGGKAIDAAKGVSRALGAAMVSVPTSASNDAPTSSIFVLYDDSHRLLSVEKLGRNPELVVVDSAVIVRAPPALLVSGIGDAIAKRFEVARCVAAGGRNGYGGRPPWIALVLAEQCYRVVREEAEGALAAVANGVVSEPFERLLEAAVLLSGLAFENGGLSIAHAMTRGLPEVLAAGRQPHGVQVAYALLVQLILEGEDDLVADLSAFYGRIGLPRSLHEIGLGDADEAALRRVAERTLDTAHSGNFPRLLRVTEMVDAIRRTGAL